MAADRNTVIGELVQKKPFGFRKHTLYPNRIAVETRNERTIERYEISLETIGFKKYYKAANTLPGKILFGIMITIIVVALVANYASPMKEGEFWLTIVLASMLAAFVYLKPHSDKIYLTGGKTSLVFHRDVPNESTVFAFIDLVVATAKTCLKEKHLKFDSDTDEESYVGLLHWLLNKEVITEDEYNEYLSEYKIKRLL